MFTGGGRLEVRCHGDRQDLPVGVCDCVRPGDRGPVRSTAVWLRLVTTALSETALSDTLSTNQGRVAE